MNRRIIIEVDGGVAYITASTVPSLQVYLVDWDNIKGGDRRSLEPFELQDDSQKQFEEKVAEIKEEARKYEPHKRS